MALDLEKLSIEELTTLANAAKAQAERLYKQFQKLHPDLKDSYGDFNYSFNGEGNGSPRLKKAFSEYMQEKGYNAMVDNFDTMRSLRSRTSRPTILFDPTASIKKVNDILLDNGKVEMTAMRYELSNFAVKAALSPKSVAVGLLAGAGVYSSARNKERPREQRVDAYKKDHPGSQLSDAQIYNLVAG